MRGECKMCGGSLCTWDAAPVPDYCSKGCAQLAKEVPWCLGSAPAEAAQEAERQRQLEAALAEARRQARIQVLVRRILQFVLDNNGQVKRHELTDHLKNVTQTPEFGPILDQMLQCEWLFQEKIPPKKPGRPVLMIRLERPEENTQGQGTGESSHKEVNNTPV